MKRERHVCSRLETFRASALSILLEVTDESLGCGDELRAVVVGT